MTKAAELNVLVLNSGSSSLKFGLYRASASATALLLSGELEAIGEKKSRFNATNTRGTIAVEESVPIPTQREAMARIGRLLIDSKSPAPDAVGHRIVHGGPRLRRHCLIDGQVLAELEAATVFAPLHNPPALSLLRFAQKHFPNLPHVACFDTTFHAGLPDVARVLPIAKELQAEGIQRYGFHGLSCESIVSQLVKPFPSRLIIAHLGNGASVTSVKDGKSVDTSMGLTPTGGVVMGTRSGDLDPGVMIYLMRKKQLDAAKLEELVDFRSGMAGISGVGSDVRILHAAAETNVDALLAIQMFCYSVRKQIAAMIAALNGVDMVVFAGGVGENDAEIRAAICNGLSWIGVSLDEARNQLAKNPLNDEGSRCAVLVLPSREDLQIACHTRSLVATAKLKESDDHE
jgi:acetate kinase